MENLHNIEHEKLEIINWVISINDENLLKKISSLKAENNIAKFPEKRKTPKTDKNDDIRKFGFGKGTFTYISDDFDAPLEEFKDYMP